MKPVYKCEYCDKMGDETTIREHEEECVHNPTNKTCYTCKHAKAYNKLAKMPFDNLVCTKNGEQQLLIIFVTHGENDCWEQSTPLFKEDK